MIQCPNCFAMLSDTVASGKCPKCGKAITGPTSAKTVNFNEATVDSTVELEMPTVSSTVDAEETSKTQGIESTKTADFNDATVEDARVEATMNLEADSAASKTKADATHDDSSHLIESDSIGATLVTVSDQENISPSATITFGPAGLTMGGVTAPQTQGKGTTHIAGAKRTGAKGNTDGNTVPAADSSIDLSRSALSTISKRTLAEKAGPLSTPPDYEIVTKLGEGGMGVVYSAIQKTLDRKVAIKAIKSSKASSDESRRKFFYEAQITSDLDHPNIVPIHDMGSNDDGTLFYSMKMVDGTPWEDVIQNKTRVENIEILMKVCDAVAFAHSRNVIHRDLKPENVMLGAFGEVLVMDWGLAVNLNTTQRFGMSGTPVYMSPEMAKHDLSKIGKASDIYILGGILFQVVVGRAPHKGKTVRECIANAIQNINIDPGFDDPILDIANHAMATEPTDRYASVVEFQDAIREHLRYAQSLALSQRAEELLENSIRNQDYQGFSRALFSMQDAIELWSENQAAKDGLHRTRLAYGQCALDRSDYDLCMQTLDTSREDEAALHKLASARKAEIVQREKRFKLLRRVLAAVILLAVVTLTLATLYARRQETLALRSAESEKAARVNEKEAKQLAQAERDNAQQSAEEEKAARKSEEKAKQIAQAERDKALIAEQKEKQAKELEVAARKQAVDSEKKAIQSEQVAVRNARLAVLGNYQSELNLALNQTNQFDLARSNQLLHEIKGIEQKVSVGHNEVLLQNWAFRRIELLNNLDLPRLHVDSPITAFQYASASDLGIIGTQNGRVSIVRLGNGNTPLSQDRNVTLQDPIRAVAISPDGEDAIIATKSQRSEFSVYRWKTSSKDATPIRSLGKRDLQQLASSPDGKWAIGGINGGLWKWERSANGFELEPTRIDCRGSLGCMQFVGQSGSEVFGLSTLPSGKSACIRANLTTNAVQTYGLPEPIANQVSTVAMSLDQKRVYLGLKDGNLLVAIVDQTSTRGVSAQRDLLVKASGILPSISVESEVQPKKHSTAVRGIEVHADGTVLTYSEEPVVHVWRAEPSTSRLVYTSYLVGLNGNVTIARFLDSGGNVAATDDLGDLLRWNILDQDDRRMRSRSVPSKLLSQSISQDETHRSIDAEGVLRTILSNADSEGASFIGHTPGAKVTDIAVASSKPLVATVALFTATANSVSSSEVCLWNTSSRTMLHRSKHNTKGDCRIAFANRDTTLVIGDENETIVLPVGSPDKSTVEKRFGTRLAASHPTQPTMTALIASSGAVRMVDWQDPKKWDDLRYRYFDIAINNGFKPVEAAWTADGKRLYQLFEHGRIARLEWDGVSLSNLSWSDEIPAIRSLEQDAPWRYFDFEVLANNHNSNIDKSNNDNSNNDNSNNDNSNNIDKLGIVHRITDPKPTSVQLRLDWSRSESKPRKASTAPIADTVKVVEHPKTVPHDVIRTSQGTSITVDGNGTLSITQPGKDTFSVGRPTCAKASHCLNGNRWSTVHSDGIVLLASISGPDEITWHQVNHPFTKVDQAELSSDGRRLAIVGRLPSGASNVACFEIVSPVAVMPTNGGELAKGIFVRWHPLDNEFVMLDLDQKWHRVDAQGKLRELKSQAWGKLVLDRNARFVDMQWLCEPTGRTTKPSWHMAVMSRSPDSSRIDIISENENLMDNFQPILSKSLITSFASSPNENVLAVGDENGTLGIWFVAPSIDQSPRELYTLPGHRGSAVIQLSFSSNGSSILSSDTGQRAIQWRSR